MKPLYADAHDPLPTAARAAILSDLGGICGVTPGSVGLVRSDASGSLLRITYSGWSPSLHEVAYDIQVFSHWQPDDPRLHRLPTEQLLHAMDLQQRRLNAGIRLGLHRPIEIPAVSFAGVATMHLRTSRALLDLAHALGHDFGEDIQEDLANLHHSDEADGYSEDLGDDRSWVTERGGERLCGRAIPIGEQNNGAWLVFDGAHLSIGGREISETAATLLVGRPLRKLVEIHPVLDALEIADIETLHCDGHPEMRIRFAPDHVAVPGPGQLRGEEQC